jgi:pimeloyl-ACP methyl ester carboxylesterase
VVNETEKNVLFTVEGEKIIGYLHLPEVRTDSLVIIAPGFTSDELGPGNSHVTLAESLVKKSIAVLRFNFRYTTPDFSEFDKMSISGEVKDLKTIIKKMSDEFSSLGLLGESLGSIISLISCSSKTKAMVFWYPPFFLKETGFKRLLTSDAEKELKTKGYVLQKKRSGVIYKVGKKLIEEVKIFDISKYVKKVTVPTLLIHGDIDTEVPIEHSKKLLELLKGEKKLITIKGMEHAIKNRNFERDLSFLPQLINPTVDWFNRWLK